MQLTISNVSKKYGGRYALKNVNLELKNGVYGLLGPNGAGKTTLINIITGILSADSGKILCDGKDVKDLKLQYVSKIGYLPQYPVFYKDFKAREFLHYIAAVKGLSHKDGVQKSEELLSMVNLSDEADKRIGSYSGGMRQRLGIAQAMLSDPELLILDEPTAGLDPKERIRFRNIISKLSAGRIVILSTHIVSDVEHIANDIILLGAGELIAKNSPENLTASMLGKVWSVTATDDTIGKYIDTFNISNILHQCGNYHLKIISDTPPDVNCKQTAPSLEDVFLYHFKEE
ncbi:MAG: ABC transporter ATP-binding protein [Oscillospiraceae bacterium]